MTGSIAAAPRSTSRSPASWSRLLKRYGAVSIGGLAFAILVFLAVAAPLVAPFDPYAQNLELRLQPPFWHDGSRPEHLLGTDNLGRDYLSRLIYGARTALLIGLTATGISAIIGVTLGALAGYFGGRIDLAVSFVLTTRLAMPVVLVALAVVGLIGASLRNVILVLGFLLWDRFAVVTRGAVAQVKAQDFVSAAMSLGCSTTYIIVRTVLPNVMNLLIVVATLEVSHAILLEAALSFLGLGVRSPTASWGLMIAEGKDFFLFSPWIIALPGFCLLAMVFGINLLGDGLRDASERGSR